MEKNLILENECIRLQISTEFGLVTSIFDKTAGLELIRDERLADNWRLLLPLPDLEANYIPGNRQPLSGFETDGRRARLRWDGPLTSGAGTYGLKVTLDIELDGRAVTFRITVENDTQWQVAEVWYAAVGGMQGLGKREDTKVLIPRAGHAFAADMFTCFQPLVELGTAEPEGWFQYPGSLSMPWMDLYDEELGRGTMFACLDEADRFKALRCEMHPGIGHTFGHNWPEADEGLPTGVTANWACFPYTGPGEKFESPQAIVQFHDGDWHDAAKLYRKWFIERFPVADAARNWMRGEPAFQNAMMLLPEGNVNYRFEDIPGWAADALEYGVKAVLVSGWQRGGHDSHYPDYSPDPRLGGWEDLKRAVGKCHEMGVKVYFFVNLQPADCNTEWYERELHRYRSMDKWGNTQTLGWGMGTLGARMGITSRKLVFLSPWFKEVRDIITKQMASLAGAGADGIHIDKLAWGNVPLDFNPLIGTSPDRASWDGMLLGVREIAEACLSVNPAFAISHEGAWDRMLEHSSVAWAWHSQWEEEHTAALKYTFPEWLPGFPITQPYDYDCVNTAMRYGYQFFIGPAYYTRSMKHPPMRGLSEYIREAIRIREELADTIYLGEFTDRQQVEVSAGPGIRFNTHRDPKTGARACVLANYSDIAQEAAVEFQGGSVQVSVYLSFDNPVQMDLPAAITIPAKRFAVVLEAPVCPDNLA